MAYDAYDYERDIETSNLATARGRTGQAARFSGRAARHIEGLGADFDPSSLDIASADEWGHVDPTQFGGAIGQLSRLAGRRTAQRGGDAGRAVNRARIGWNNSLSDLNAAADLRRGEAEFKSDDENVYQPALDRLSGMANTAAISADQESALRAKIGGQITTASLSNLARAGSSLGIRGIADSPAGAALASDVARDYDSMLTTQLRDMGFQVQEINRDQARKDTAAVTALATLRRSAEQAHLSNDRDAVRQIGQETAALIDALYARDKTFELYEEMMDGGSDGPTGVQGAMSGAMTGMRVGGPWGALIGGVAGGAAGHFGGAEGVQVVNGVGSMLGGGMMGGGGAAGGGM